MSDLRATLMEALEREPTLAEVNKYGLTGAPGTNFNTLQWRLDLIRAALAAIPEPTLDAERLVALANEAFATAADGIRGGVPNAGREQCAREWAAQQVGYYARSWFNDKVTREYARLHERTEPHE